jgi:tetratricopeptide (TPR) repeat protein
VTAPHGSGLFKNRWVAPGILALLTILAYARSFSVPIHDMDDYFYYFRDARLEHLSADNLWRILTQPFFANFHPLTSLTYAFDRAVWGTWVPGFHLTQLCFYLGGVLGLYLLFDRVLQWRGGAFAASALYAVHAVHVESVAWLASRKDVVCLLFYAFALLAYVRYAARPTGGWGPYAASVVLAGAAMFSKGYAVVLPGIFLAYDFCFAGRLTRRHLLDKIPYVALAAATTLLTIHAQDRDSALVTVSLSAGDRMWRLSEIFARYVFHTLLPVRLSAVYPYGLTPAVDPIAWMGLFLAAGLVFSFFALRRKNPAAAFGLALFVLPLATVMNSVFTLRIWMTDRYLFFPTIGSSLALVALAAPVFRGRTSPADEARLKPMRAALAAAAVLTIGLYAALTVSRIGVWTSGVRLWSDVLRRQLDLSGSGPLTTNEIERAPARHLVNSSPIVSLMGAYESEGNREESARLAAFLNRGTGGDEAGGEMVLARADLEAGRWAEAARRLRPLAEGTGWSAPQALVWLSVAEDRLGNTEVARQTLERGLARYRETGQPPTDALLDVGIIQFNKGSFLQALELFRAAQAASPSEARATFFLGRALEEVSRFEEALSHYQRIARGDLKILPQSQFTLADVYLEMAVVEEKMGRRADALGHFEETLRLAPQHPKRAAVLAKIAALRAGGAP